MNKFLLLFLLSPLFSIAQNLHPTTADMGCCSEKTGIPIYTYAPPSQEPDLMQIYEVNKFSEKSIFYFGKFDPWSDAEMSDTDIYDQDYIYPPGAIPIAEGVFLDQTEVANIHYQEFLFFMVKDSGKYSDRNYLPKCENKINFKYFLNEEFAMFPIVSVDFSHAESYCQWRADKLNDGLDIMLADELEKYEFLGRLPTEKEWFLAAGSHEEFVKETNYELKKKNKLYLEEDVLPNRFINEVDLRVTKFKSYNAHFKHPEGLPIEIPQYIYSFEPNNRGFYNLYGNAKELVQEGYAIGGSFNTLYSDENIREKDDIQAYRSDVGFRCIVEIIKK